MKKPKKTAELIILSSGMTREEVKILTSGVSFEERGR
jgi:hypothetical protein